MAVLFVCFSSCEFCQYMSFKGSVYFMQIIKFWGTEFFVVLFYVIKSSNFITVVIKQVYFIFSFSVNIHELMDLLHKTNL